MDKIIEGKKILHLTLKKKWFDMISEKDQSKRKNEEYREIKPYWVKRLCSDFYAEYPYDINKVSALILENFNNSDLSYSFNHFDLVYFHWGYKKNHPITIRKFNGIDIGSANTEWSDSFIGNVFRIKLGGIISNTQNK